MPSHLAVLLTLITLSKSSLLNETLPIASTRTLNGALSFPSRALNPNDVTATVLSEQSPIHSSLFASVHPQPASESELAPGVHPRIVVGANEWDELLGRYADPAYFDVEGTWSRYHRQFTLSKGPNSDFIGQLAAIQDGVLSLYEGGAKDLTVLSESERSRLLPLVQKSGSVTELRAASLFMCAFWASVSRKRVELIGEAGRFLPADQVETCIRATVTWATVMLAHRAYYCNPSCPSSSKGREYVWDYNMRWDVWNEWYTATFSMAMSYDVLYSDMTTEQRRRVRSALMLLVMKRYSWGNSEFSDRSSPNAKIHPHRIFSNWALYHSNLYLASLAIEGETDFDAYTNAVLAMEGETGFNVGQKERSEAMIEAYMTHSFYGDGSTYEDGYSYFIALREGSLSLVAAHRRGMTILDTPRFRNLIHNAAQMYEPWRCGSLIGHASGGGNSYPAHMGLFRYAYPEGVLPNMLWRMRMGDDFVNNNPCRIEWFQNMIQLTFLGGEHGAVTDAESLETLPDSSKEHIPLSYYAPRRGLLIARNSLSEKSIMLHFDARPDAFYPGHDNADRGVFTFTALRRTWIGELHWRDNVDSRRHSLLHVDGLAQDEKAPCVTMMKVEDNGAVVIASANLTYAYNIQWARNWPFDKPPNVYVITYVEDGTSSRVPTTFTEPEYGDPRDFGWPAGDLGEDLGLTRPESNMHRDPDMGFRGMWTWKRDYRTVPLFWAVRSVALIRSDESVGPGYALVVDSFQVAGSAGNHVFESYLIFEAGVDVHEAASSCIGNTCMIALMSVGSSDQVDLHVMTLGTLLSYRTETFDGHKRLIMKSEGMQGEEFWIAFNPHSGDDNGLAMTKLADGIVQITYKNEHRYFKVSPSTHDLELSKAPHASSSPMAPTQLPFKKKTQIESDELNSNPEEYLHDNGAAYQLVFKVTARTPKKMNGRGDRFQTCFAPETNAPTSFALYDCGYAPQADVNYANRACTLVDESTPQDSCRVFRTRMTRRLVRDKPYFLAVSVMALEGVSAPRFMIKHSRAKVTN